MGTPQTPASVQDMVFLKDNEGAKVAAIKKALVKQLGDSADLYPTLATGNTFDADTEAALRNWQASVGLVPDGVAGPRTLCALGVFPLLPLAVPLTTPEVKKVFPAATKASNISKNLPYVLDALAAFGLTDLPMIAVALATIRAETEGFVPIAELRSKFNTRPGEAPFSAYDGQYEVGKRLGNTEPGDGALFCGRGYVQLTGRFNYTSYGTLLGLPLVIKPELALCPEIAACLLALYLFNNQAALRKALKANDLRAARKVVNGGSHGLARFKETFEQTMALWAPAAVARVAKKGAARAAAKPAVPAAVAARRANLKVVADSVDLRDREYLPPPITLSEQYPPDDQIKTFIANYTAAKLVLNQGSEGACTGFALAGVINYLRWVKAGTTRKLESVSPRMLYKLARRYDEYEGEDYEGSSCRGALKGWFFHGVCLESLWPYQAGENNLPKAGWDDDARERTLGVYYRIDKKSIIDLQAAIAEVGAIYVSAYTHAGWDDLEKHAKAPQSHKEIPVIEYNGRPSRTGGHAFALVGFNRQGFVIQNSWGNDWGAGGFAVITYEDWLAHTMDAWVIAMGVPGIVAGRFGRGKGTAGSGSVGKSQPGWWDEDTAYHHSIVLGNNGRVNHYLPRDAVSLSLQYQACVAPDEWFRAQAGKKKRLVIYVHGGLNSEGDAIDRARAMGRYFIGNGCYPLFMVWKSGLFESFSDILHNAIRPGAAQPGLAGGWFDEKISDPVLEKTVGNDLAKPLWTQMKQNAELASLAGRGADLMIDAIKALAESWGEDFELHLVGHSAGSIMLGKMLANLADKNLLNIVKSCHLYAPACTVACANQEYAVHPQVMENLYIDILSDRCEQADNVAQVYRKSLLYFVANALEAQARTPILGLNNVLDPKFTRWDGAGVTSGVLNLWRETVRATKLKSRLTIHDEDEFVARRAKSGASEKRCKASHGGFDNNVDVVSQTLQRILGGKLTMPVDDLVGF